jgi:ABC-type uncharacterized transport system permease subunit
MNFITQVTVSVIIYFLLRIFLKDRRSVYISSAASSFSYIFLYSLAYGIISNTSDIHFVVTGLSLIFIFIAFYEMVVLEKTMLDLKNGDFNDMPKFSIEKSYKIVFKLLGIGLLFLILSFLSGFVIQSIFTTNLIIKVTFASIALVIYLITLIGIKRFNLTIKSSVRNLFIALCAVWIAYIGNVIFIYN